MTSKELADLVLDAYPGGPFFDKDQYTTLAELVQLAEPNKHGDSLFTFIVRELDETAVDVRSGRADLDTAAAEVSRAIEDLEAVLLAIEEARHPNSER